MSFIYEDDNLINDLLNIGIDQSNKLLKRAQVINPAAMQGLLDRLGNELTGAPTPEQGTQSNIVAGTDAGLYLNHIDSLRNVVLFLNQNQFKYKGFPIVIVNQTAFTPGAPSTTPEFDTLMSRQQRAQYAPYPPVEGGIKADRKSFQFFVHKEGLLNYLQDLLNKAKDVNQPIFTKKLMQIIGEANKDLGLQFTQTQEDKTPAEVVPDKDQKGFTSGKGENVSYKRVQDKGEQGEQGQLPPTMAPFTMPFDLVTDEINIGLMSAFLAQMMNLLRVPNILTEIGPQSRMWLSSVQNALNLISRWETTAAPAARDGFSLPLGAQYSIEAFVSTYAEGDRRRARDMASLMLSICNQIVAILNQLNSSPTISKFMVGEGTLQQQTERGRAYITYLQNMMNRLAVASQPPR